MQVVIIGAGRAGRGYLGRLAAQSGASITFLDQDAALVEALRGGSYTVRFFGDSAPAQTIGGYQIYHISDPSARQALREAEVILTAVGQSTLPSLTPLLSSALDGCPPERRPVLLCCENGVHSSAALQPAASSCFLSEGVIFCTTVTEGLDIRSQDLSWLPYDGTRLPMPLPLYGFSPEADFETLLQRKIYTYNCLSACISYLGYQRGYREYAAAANDPHISSAIAALLTQLNPAICAEYGVAADAQAQFAQQAVDKFQNREIVDSVERNARNALRKIGPTERIVAPMRLIQKHGGDPAVLRTVLAAALLYGAQEEPSAADWQHPEQILNDICRLEEADGTNEILRQYRRMRK